MSNYRDEIPLRYEVMMSYLPSYYQKSPQMNNIMKALGAEIDEIRALNKSLLNESFIGTTESEIARYENIFGVKPKLTDTLEQRTARLLANLSFRPPLTVNQMKQLVNNFVEEKNADVQEIVGEYAFIVILQPGSHYDYGSITAVVEHVKPAHLEAIYSTNVSQNIIEVQITSRHNEAIYPRFCNTFYCGA